MKYNTSEGQKMSENRIAEILQGFELYNGNYKRAEVDAAVELQEEITPHLITILERMLANPSEYLAVTYTQKS